MVFDVGFQQSTTRHPTEPYYGAFKKLARNRAWYTSRMREDPWRVFRSLAFAALFSLDWNVRKEFTGWTQTLTARLPCQDNFLASATDAGNTVDRVPARIYNESCSFLRETLSRARFFAWKHFARHVFTCSNPKVPLSIRTERSRRRLSECLFANDYYSLEEISLLLAFHQENCKASHFSPVEEITRVSGRK